MQQNSTLGYEFTPSQDWFSFNIDSWRSIFPRVLAQSPRVLEIGSWEGRSAVFLLTELCQDGGELVSIDHFDLMTTEAGQERYRKLAHNLSLTGKPFRIIDEFSVPGLMTLLTEEMSAAEPGFDWIYVDGSHEADDTFLDGELMWRLARKGAIVIFDDYHWDKEPEDSVHHPRRGIDAFLALHAGQYILLSSETQYQVILQKTTDMRIGFLVKEKQLGSKERLASALNYGIHVALTIDEGYAVAAAVAIRSAVMYTTGRVTFYVVGRDIAEETRAKLRGCISDEREKTIAFIDLPGHSQSSAQLALPDHLTWGKIAMVPLLPVERVLYLDADVLVRGDLHELWDMDLGGKPLAAAPDVGLPNGHDALDMKNTPYFNAGVLLMDLALVRMHLSALHTLATKMRDSSHKDQDVLNVHFKGDWQPLSLRWNAQGLGTYARYRTPERDALDLEEMDDPKIVHFTGPLHPSLAEVLNPFVQPFTSKPWGYAGAPGHPYADDWWSILEETTWRGWRTSSEYIAICEKQKGESIRIAVEAFLNSFV
ncbi:glycosyl transferase [Lentinus tigrinus ALCF2SS1-7]|uniref:Glycosyl transferase n=1 Tax=Lentinus tigrinus ALCF2SS1-6 TaxID=1328759 RepID=A0A5C2SE97_9APHY|nr:glycosyl transferase [Lentinus tigrinus ALCF2SS1-6]RPD74601.1 glycosyl transferase [Lentinus tigrinus ALCF2SS1-7]